MRLVPCGLLLGFCLLAASAWGQERFEILTLRHRTVDQVLPALHPLVAPGGAISGLEGKIMVRTDARNLEEIRAALASLDSPVARLMVSVRVAGEAEVRRRDIEVSGSLGGDRVRIIRPPGLPANTRIEGEQGGQAITLGGQDRHARQQEQLVQQVQTVDGGQAFLQAGVSVPVSFRQMVLRPDGLRVQGGKVYRDLGSGFVARPQLMGERVRVAVSPSLARFGGDGFERTELSTTVEGPLGEWLPLGESGTSREGAGGDLLSRRSTAASQDQRLWLKVERLP